MSNEKIKQDRAFNRMIDPDAIFDKINQFKETMQENLSEEDSKAADLYLDQIAKQIQPTIDRMNEVLQDNGSRKNLMDSIKQAMKDEQWLEKLSQTSYKTILETEQETE